MPFAGPCDLPLNKDLILTSRLLNLIVCPLGVVVVADGLVNPLVGVLQRRREDHSVGGWLVWLVIRIRLTW